MRTFLKACLTILCLSYAEGSLTAGEADIPADIAPLHSAPSAPSYYWVATPIAGGSELLTLFGRFGSAEPDHQNVPLVALLRDGIPDGGPGTDRLRYVWLLTYRQPKLSQRILSAVPFFYWPLGLHPGQQTAGKVKVKPLLDLSQPTPRVWKTAARDILQWTVLDPMTMPVRASTRAYRTNGRDRERLHVEEAIAFLRNAPVSDAGPGLSQTELNNVLARLSLTKNLLGGLVTDGQLDRVTEGRDAMRSQTVGRNWELLRTSAERAGLVFEPLSLTNSGEEYAVLWFPLGTAFSAPGLSLDTTWKLLHITDPWADSRLKNWNGYSETRSFDHSGRVLSEGISGVTTVRLAPLAVYSLTFPRAPLLMVDFRNTFRPKRRELAQRASDEIVSGVLGLSHFGNWYYYAGNGAYQFVKARRGSAEDRAQRLDSYSQFRAALALDTSLNRTFQEELQRRIEALAVNPLETKAGQDIAAARQHFNALLQTAANEKGLPARVDRDRRRELAAFGEGSPGVIWANVLHYASFGAYTRIAPRDEENEELLSRDRKIEAQIRYLDRVAVSGPRPEITFPVERIEDSIDELMSVMTRDVPQKVRRRASAAIAKVQAQTKSDAILAGCDRALAMLNAPAAPATAALKASSPENSAFAEADRSMKTK